MLSDEYTKAAKDVLVSLRNDTKRGELSRWAFLQFNDAKVLEKKNYVCVAGLNRSDYWQNRDVGLVFAFNGEAPANSRADSSILGGGKLSKEWLKFLLGPETPFPDVLPIIHNIEDIDGINEEHGFIFTEDYLNVPSGQFRGFLIASRYAQEEHNRAKNWLNMVNMGVHPRIAWALSFNYAFGEGYIISKGSLAGHSVFYNPLGEYLPRLFKMKYRPEKSIFEANNLAYFSDKVHTEQENDFSVGFNDPKANLGVKLGMNILEAQEVIIKTIEETYGDFNG